MNELASKLFSMLPDRNKEDNLMPYITQVNNDLTDYMRYQKNFDPEKELRPSFEQIGFEDIHELLLQDVSVLRVLENIFNELAATLIIQQASMVKIKSMFESLDSITLDPASNLSSFGLPSNFFSSLSSNPPDHNSPPPSAPSPSSPSLASWGFSMKQSLDSFRVLAEQEIARTNQAEKYQETARLLRQERHSLMQNMGDYFKQLFLIEKEVSTAEKKLSKAKETLEMKFKTESEKALKKFSPDDFLPETYYTSYAIVSSGGSSNSRARSNSVSTISSLSGPKVSTSSSGSGSNSSWNPSTSKFSIIPHPSLHQEIRSLSHALNHRDLFHAAVRLALSDLHEKIFTKIDTTLKNFFSCIETSNSSLQIIMNLLSETSQAVSFKRDLDGWIKKKMSSSSSSPSPSSGTVRVPPSGGSGGASGGNQLVLFSQAISMINNLSVTTHEKFFADVIRDNRRFYYHFFDYDLTKSKINHLDASTISSSSVDNKINRFKNFLSSHLFHNNSSISHRNSITTLSTHSVSVLSPIVSASSISSQISLNNFEKLIDYFLKQIFHSKKNDIFSNYYNFFSIKLINLINNNNDIKIITKKKTFFLALPPTLSLVEKKILIQSPLLISSLLFFNFYIFSDTFLREKFVSQLNRYRSSKICLKTRNFLSLVVLLWLFLVWCNGYGQKIVEENLSNDDEIVNGNRENDKKKHSDETTSSLEEDVEDKERKSRRDLRRNIDLEFLQKYSAIFADFSGESSETDSLKDVDVRSARVVLMLSETFYRIRSPSQSLLHDIETRPQRKASDVSTTQLPLKSICYCFLCGDSMRQKTKLEEGELKEENDRDDSEDDEEEDDEESENPLRGVRYRQYIQEKLIGHPIWNDAHFWQRTLWDSTRDSLLSSLPSFLFYQPGGISNSSLHSSTSSNPSVSSPVSVSSTSLSYNLIRPWFDLNPNQRLQAIQSVHTVLTNHALALSHALLILTNNNNISKQSSMLLISNTLNTYLQDTSLIMENSNCCKDCFSLVHDESFLQSFKSSVENSASDHNLNSLEFSQDSPSNLENFNSSSPTVRAREFIFRAAALHGLPQSLRLFLLNHIEEQEILSQSSSADSSLAPGLTRSTSGLNRNRIHSPTKGSHMI